MGYSDKPINEFQSLSRKPVNDGANEYNVFQFKRCVASITPMGKAVKAKSIERFIVFKEALIKAGKSQANKRR